MMLPDPNPAITKPVTWLNLANPYWTLLLDEGWEQSEVADVLGVSSKSIDC